MDCMDIMNIRKETDEIIIDCLIGNNEKILIVDDDISISEILEFNLRNEGFEVDVSFSAEEALKKSIDKGNSEALIKVQGLFLKIIFLGRMEFLLMPRRRAF